MPRADPTQPPTGRGPWLPRRRFLGAVAGCAAAATLLWRRLSASDEDDAAPHDGPSSVAGARAVPRGEVPQFPGGPALAFLALGDTGWGGESRASVVAAMERTASVLPFSSVCLLGDNFYPHGVQSIDDPQWSGFERAFAGPHLAVPFHAALGNHDHHGNVEAQVEYSATSSRWRMPGQYYSFVERAGEGFDAEFFVLDTECIRREERASTEQLRWFEDKLSRSRVRWKIVVGHHPVRSNGEHGGIDRVRDAIEDLMHDHGVALYLSGHDHDLELLATERGFLQVVSGAGSSTRDMCWGRDTLFASAAPGFVWVGLELDRLQLVFVDAVRGPLFARSFALRELVARAPAVSDPEVSAV